MQWYSSKQQTAYATGFGCRFGLHYHPDSEGLYIVEYMFIVLSACPSVPFPFLRLTKSCIAMCIYCSKLYLAGTGCEAYIMPYTRLTACTEIDARFHVLGYHNIPDSSHRRRNDRLSQSNSAANRLACALLLQPFLSFLNPDSKRYFSLAWCSSWCRSRYLAVFISASCTGYIPSSTIYGNVTSCSHGIEIGELWLLPWLSVASVSS